MARTSPPRVPVVRLVSVLLQHSRMSRPAVGSEGMAIEAVRTTDVRSSVTSRRRGGTRSTMPDRSVPPTRYGRNPSAKVSEDRNGDPVRVYTRTVRATAETTDPVVVTVAATKMARNSRTPNAARYGPRIRPVASMDRWSDVPHPPARDSLRSVSLGHDHPDRGRAGRPRAVRFAWSPLWETLHAVRTFVDPAARPYHAAWHAVVADEFARLDLTPILAINPRRGYTPDFVTPPPTGPDPSLRDQLEAVRATPANQVAAELRRCREGLTDPDARQEVDRLLEDPAASRELLADRARTVWERIVAPFWARVRRLLDADIAHQSRELSRRGLAPMIDG